MPTRPTSDAAARIRGNVSQSGAESTNERESADENNRVSSSYPGVTGRLQIRNPASDRRAEGSLSGRAPRCPLARGGVKPRGVQIPPLPLAVRLQCGCSAVAVRLRCDRCAVSVCRSAVRFQHGHSTTDRRCGCHTASIASPRGRHTVRDSGPRRQGRSTDSRKPCQGGSGPSSASAIVSTLTRTTAIFYGPTWRDVVSSTSSSRSTSAADG